MKKTISIIALVLAITVSLIAGTMSYYTITLDEVAGGSVVAKEFILMEDETIEKTFNEKIAPGETVNLVFAVKNFNANAVSETKMDVSFKLALGENGDLEEIAPLKIKEVSKHKGTWWDKDGLTFENGIYTDKQFLPAEATTRVYRVTVEWPWGTADDDAIQYAGAGHGSALTVTVTGTQVQP
ncbi:MAG TPA: hypothetical protein PK646_05125 [Bacillota bacterium]|nr:hypothetical protein [Fastidiosipila sp.]HPX93705.1 hypothetical protein [Bacillota bacterium]HQB81453.1 hypothetical protein [Bacillota bacterium]